MIPNGQGTTTGIIKRDWVSGHWQWGTSITETVESFRRASFSATAATGLSATAKRYLQAMALLPEDGAAAGDYSGDYFYADNAAEERCTIRAGAWNDGTAAGVFCLIFHNPRPHLNGGLGGRPAYGELETE